MEGVELDPENTEKERTFSFQSKEIAGSLQKVWPDFKHIFHYLENRILPDDKKLAHTKAIEAASMNYMMGYFIITTNLG